MHFILAATLVMTSSLCSFAPEEDADPIVNEESSGDSQAEDLDEGFSFDDFDVYIEPWIYVSIPEFGMFSLREVLDEGTDGWDAFLAYGDPIESYESINIFTPSADAHNAGIVVLMPRVECLGDFNSDGVVDVSDLVIFAQAYIDGDLVADLTNDGVLDIADQILFFNLAMMGCVIVQ